MPDVNPSGIVYVVGMTGFEPATTRPPAVYANRTAPHPDFGGANLFILNEFLQKKLKNSTFNKKFYGK